MESPALPTTYQDWSAWHASIDPERESLLLHEDTTRLVAKEALADMFGASCQVKWNDLEERLRDLESPNLLFTGFEVLLQNYTGSTVIRTIPEIALIAVSLNNYTSLHNLPCKTVFLSQAVSVREARILTSIVKFCWSHVSWSTRGHDMFMAFGAWSAKERKDWMSMSPGIRAKRCTAWESTILRRYEKMAFVPVTANNISS
jgi:hypothetical protein